MNLICSDDSLDLKIYVDKFSIREILQGMKKLKHLEIELFSLSTTIGDLKFAYENSRDKYSETKINLGSKNYRFMLSNTTMDFLLNYLIRYNENGFADSEHVDIDFYDEQYTEVILTIHAAESNQTPFGDLHRMLEDWFPWSN